MVKLLDDGSFVIPGEEKAHASLDALVTFHQQQPVRPHGDLLTQPCGQVSVGTPVSHSILTGAKPPDSFCSHAPHSACCDSVTVVVPALPRPHPSWSSFPALPQPPRLIFYKGSFVGDQPWLIYRNRVSPYKARGSWGGGEEGRDTPPGEGGRGVLALRSYYGRGMFPYKVCGQGSS